MSDQHVAILGAGTMGAGIAQVAAASGWTAHVMDVDEPTVATALQGVAGRFTRLVEKGRLTADEARVAAARLRVAATPADFAECDLLVEAVPEDLSLKTTLLNNVIPALPEDAIIATNTSSISVTTLGAAIGQPNRTVGMHFFNPAPIMRLVEVIAGDETDPRVVDRTADIAASWGKTVARAADVPGFIVNHVARPYYLEAFRIVEDGIAPPDVIDAAMTGVAGFRMGPLELTDLIGQDVNTATTRSVWEQLGHPPLLHPSALQEQLVADGHLGRKTGRGVYDHAADPRTVALPFAPRTDVVAPEVSAAAAAFCAAAGFDGGDALDKYVVARILAGLIVQASHAFARRVADRADIDIALRNGVNYPIGPFALGADVGVDAMARLLDTLNATVDDDRFALPEMDTVRGVEA